MDKTRTIGQKWLANELDLHFLTLNKCTRKANPMSILSKVIVLILHKSNTFSDENVKILVANFSKRIEK